MKHAKTHNARAPINSIRSIPAPEVWGFQAFELPAYFQYRYMLRTTTINSHSFTLLTRSIALLHWLSLCRPYRNRAPSHSISEVLDCCGHRLILDKTTSHAHSLHPLHRLWCAGWAAVEQLKHVGTRAPLHSISYCVHSLRFETAFASRSIRTSPRFENNGLGAEAGLEYMRSASSGRFILHIAGGLVFV
jgi:hypothetical protein